MANTEKGQLFTGARARLIANDVRVGWATGVSGSRSYMKEGVEVLDNLEVEEYATLGYRVSLRMSQVGLVEKSLVTAGLLPAIGQSNEDHLRNLLAQVPFTVQVLDNKTGKVRWEWSKCEIEGESFNINARSLLLLDISMVAIRLADVAET